MVSGEWYLATSQTLSLKPNRARNAGFVASWDRSTGRVGEVWMSIRGENVRSHRIPAGSDHAETAKQ